MPSQNLADIISGIPGCLTVLTDREQKILGGEWASDTKLSGLPTVRAVVNSVIKKVYELDTLPADKDRIIFDDHWAFYRGGAQVAQGSTYPAHALISVDSIETANDVADYMNKVFSLDRGSYPKKEGWQAMAVHSRTSEDLDSSHPFFRYKQNGRIDSRCCRFLIVKSMAIEGMNNYPLCVWGAAETFSSVRQGVQRLGRIMRSAAKRHGRVLEVPPASHDQIYVITHELFSTQNSSTVETICQSIDFITDMHRATADIMTLDEYVEMDVANIDADEVSRASQLGRWAKFAIAIKIGQALRQGRRPQIARIVRESGAAGHMKQAYVRAFAESCLNDHASSYPIIKDGVEVDRPVDAIADIKSGLLRIEAPGPVSILEDARMAIRELDDDYAQEWLSRFEFGPMLLANKDTFGDQHQWLVMVNQMHVAWEGRFNKHELEVRQTPAARLIQIADEIVSQLGMEQHADRVNALVYEGALSHLSNVLIRSMSDFEEDGDFCRPEITHAFRQEQFTSQVSAWVCFMLLREGLLDDLWAVLRYERFWERGSSI